MNDIEFTTSANVHLLSDADKQKLQEMTEMLRKKLEQQKTPTKTGRKSW